MPIFRVNYRRHSLLTIFLSIIPLFVVGGTNYIVDPLQVYRKQQFDIPMFWWNQRAQNAGKIRSYLSSDGYDSILVGNSVADNFRSSQITTYLGWEKTMKLTVDGGHASEQAFMVEKALQQANIKRIIWVIRIPTFLSRQEENWHKTRQIPSVDHNILRIIREFSDVEFILLIAPTSRQRLASSGSQYLSRYFGAQKYLVSKTSDLLNVRLYAFENVDYIVDNLANYRDAIHYHSGVNNEMLKAIANDHNRLTYGNIDDYILEISKKLCSFSIKSDFLTMIPFALQEERIVLSELLLKAGSNHNLNQ